MVSTARPGWRSWSAGMAVLSLLAAGCGGGGADGGVELRYSWWGNADRAELMREAIELFERRHPDITVTPTFSEYDAYWEKLSTEAAGGGMPDVMQMDFAYLREYADRGVLADLSEYEGAELDLSDMLDPFDNAGLVENARYAVPIGGNTFTLFYNPAAFDAADATVPERGWSWEDYDSAIETVAESPKTDIYGGADYTGLIWVFELRLRQEGGRLFTEDGRLGFDAERLAKFWSGGAPMRDSAAVIPPSEALQVQPVSPLGADLVASEFSWDNFHARFAEEAEAELELAPVPTDDPSNTGQYLKPALMLSASSRTEHPREAAALIDFMINDPEVGEIFGGSRGIPATHSQREAGDFTEIDEAILAYEEGLEDQLGEPPPAPPAGSGALEAEFIRLHEEVAFERMSAQEAAAAFLDFADRTLDS